MNDKITVSPEMQHAVAKYTLGRSLLVGYIKPSGAARETWLSHRTGFNRHVFPGFYQEIDEKPPGYITSDAGIGFGIMRPGKEHIPLTMSKMAALDPENDTVYFPHYVWRLIVNGAGTDNYEFKHWGFDRVRSLALHMAEFEMPMLSSRLKEPEEYLGTLPSSGAEEYYPPKESLTPDVELTERQAWANEWTAKILKTVFELFHRLERIFILVPKRGWTHDRWIRSEQGLLEGDFALALCQAIEGYGMDSFIKTADQKIQAAWAASSPASSSRTQGAVTKVLPVEPLGTSYWQVGRIG